MNRLWNIPLRKMSWPRNRVKGHSRSSEPTRIDPPPMIYY